MQAPASRQEMESAPSGLKMSFGDIYCCVEPRFIVVALLVLPLYTVAAFVGNDWAYMMPCTLAAALFVGTLLPFLAVTSISCSCNILPKDPALGGQEILLKAWRLPFFGLLSRFIPSGYLNARVYLARRLWKGFQSSSAVLPIPVVLDALSKGMEIRLRTPALGRGVYVPHSLEISSCFPFAMVWWARRILLDEDSSITVLPSVYQLAGSFHSRIQTRTINAGRSLRSLILQQRSSTLKGLREFTERDSLNQIHWPSSARSGKFLVREFEVESLPDFDVSLDLVSDWNDHQFDLACTAAMALIHYGYSSGFSPQLKLNPPLDWEPLAEQLADIPPGCVGEELIAETLTRLAPVPADLLRAYKTAGTELKKNVLDINTQPGSDLRALISLKPVAGSRTKNGAIALVEMQNFQNSVAQSVANLVQLESESEIGRI